jgi:Mg2+ and Co2+ transporter CorA
MAGGGIDRRPRAVLAEKIDNADHLSRFREHGGISPAARNVPWIDLLQPTNEERARVESSYDLKLPSREELSEVELSSRISEENGVLFLNMPTVSHMSGLDQAPSPVGACNVSFRSY